MLLCSSLVPPWSLIPIPVFFYLGCCTPTWSLLGSLCMLFTIHSTLFTPPLGLVPAWLLKLFNPVFHFFVISPCRASAWSLLGSSSILTYLIPSSTHPHSAWSLLGSHTLLYMAWSLLGSYTLLTHLPPAALTPLGLVPTWIPFLIIYAWTQLDPSTYFNIALLSGSMQPTISIPFL